MEKVKVSKELATAITEVLEVVNGDKNKLIKAHGNDEKWTNEKLKILNSLSTLELAEILINGYKIELTQEEKILLLYNTLPSNDDYDCGRRHGISETLSILKIKVKGINSVN